MAEIKKPLIDPDKIIKDVFDVSGIEAKTELTASQIESVNKLGTLANLFGSDLLNNHIKSLMVLQKSKDRKSMSEFVESLKSKKDELIDKVKNFSFTG